MQFAVRAFLFIAVAGGLAGATTLRAQDYARDTEPKLFSYDELLRLNLDQELSPESAEKSALSPRRWRGWPTSEGR